MSHTWSSQMHDKKTITQAEALAALLEAVQQLIRETRQQREQFDEFAAVYLRSRFPNGRPTDKWARR